MLIIIVFGLFSDTPSGLFFVHALLLSILTPLLPSLSVSLSCYIIAVSMRECLGKHSCISSPISYSHTVWYLIFRSVNAMNNWKLSTIKQILLSELTS